MNWIEKKKEKKKNDNNVDGESIKQKKKYKNNPRYLINISKSFKTKL